MWIPLTKNHNSWLQSLRNNVIKPNLVTSIKRIAEICILFSLTKHFAMYKYILHKCSKIKQPWTLSIKNNIGATITKFEYQYSYSFHNDLWPMTWPLTFVIFVHFIWICGIFGLGIFGTFHFELKYDGVFRREIFTCENIYGVVGGIYIFLL